MTVYRSARRQAEILALLAEALTTAEIGERLKLSPRTVEAHLRTLYRKIDVLSRTRPPATRSSMVTAARHAPVIILPTEGTRRQGSAAR